MWVFDTVSGSDSFGWHARIGISKFFVYKGDEDERESFLIFSLSVVMGPDFLLSSVVRSTLSAPHQSARSLQTFKNWSMASFALKSNFP
jgi:hypothetical protein